MSEKNQEQSEQVHVHCWRLGTHMEVIGLDLGTNTTLGSYSVISEVVMCDGCAMVVRSIKQTTR